MKLSKTLLGAMLVGVAVQASSCKKDDPKPRGEQASAAPKPAPASPDNCPACGRG